MKFVVVIASCFLISFAQSVVQNAVFGGYYCVDGFCLNGGTCVDHTGSSFSPSYASCTCVTGFKGPHCEFQTVVDCNGNSAPDVWVGDGICQDGNAKFDSKFISLNCAAHDNDGGDCGAATNPNTHTNCESTTCGTGKCYGSNTKHWCACPRNAVGPACQITVDGCSTSPCQNGARCITDITLVGNYKCVCAGLYYGTNCSTPYPSGGGGSSPSCASGCSGHGYCYATDSCSCYTGYYGTSDCAAKTSCNSSPCQNGGTCTYDSSNSDEYDCVCASGFDGTVCQTAIPICTPEPCQNSGKCKRSGSLYNCDCSTSYRGLNCTKGIAGFDCATNTYDSTMFPAGWISDSICEHQYTYISSSTTGGKPSRYSLLPTTSCGAAGDHDCPTETGLGVRFTYSVLSLALLFIAYALL